MSEEAGGVEAPLNRTLEMLGEAFETELRRYVAGVARSGPIPNLHDAMAYALGTDIEDPALRGKRIRPLLCLLTARALGARSAEAMPFALAIELMHNFALVHDDMQDGDVMRRGRDAVWVRYGAAHAINIGDYLLVHANRVLADAVGLAPETRVRLLALIGSALDHTHVGQALDMNARAGRDVSLEDYLRIVREKTGHYLAAPIQGGAIVAGAGEPVLAAIGEMAGLLGPMFQIIDDIIDLTDGKGREAVGSDIREGKRSYLVAHAAARAAPEERERLFRILDAPRDQTTLPMIAEAAEIFERHGSVAAGRVYCNELYADSRRVLETMPAPLSRALGEVLEMLVRRKH